MKFFSSKDCIRIHISDARFCTERFLADAELIYVLEGAMELTLGDQVYVMKPEDVVVVNANKQHSYRTDPESIFFELRIPLNILSSAQDCHHSVILCNSVVEENENYEALRSILKKLLNYYVRQGSEGVSLGMLSLFYALLEMIQVHFTLSRKNSNMQDDKYYERTEQINRYIRSNYNEAISLKELAEHLYLSNAYLSRFFKKNYGMNFEKYLRNVRISHAMDDLLYTDHTIVRIAVDNGFSNATHFGRAFKAARGVTPTEFRSLAQQKTPEEEGQKQAYLTQRLENYLRQNTKALILPEKRCIVEADTEQSVSYVKNWNKVINIGPASDLLRADIQEHVKVLKKQLSFTYVRIWNLFSEQMLVQKVAGTGKYYFRKIDLVLDFLVENQICPFLDLGMEPKVVIGNLRNMVYQEGNIRAAYEQEEWREQKYLLIAFFRHVLKRYGREQLRNWRIELWDKSQGNDQTKEMLLKYLSVFDMVYRVIKDILPDIKVGGCGSTALFNKKMFCRRLEFWPKYAPLPDFFSVKLYGYIKGEDDRDIFANRTTDSRHFPNQLKEIKKIMKEYNFEVPELYVTEWNQTLSARNFINDSCFKGAYNMQNLIQTIGECDIIAYYTGTDRESEFFDTGEILHGGLGLITKDGIMKPAGYAFSFLNQLYGRYLSKDPSYIMTIDGHDHYAIACHNLKNLNYYYYLTDEMKIEKGKLWLYYEDTDAFEFHFRLTNVKDGKYRMKLLQINENAGSILDLWKANDFYDENSFEPIQYYQRIIQPNISFKHMEARNGILELPVTMLPNEIALLLIESLS